MIHNFLVARIQSILLWSSIVPFDTTSTKNFYNYIHAAQFIHLFIAKKSLK